MSTKLLFCRDAFVLWKITYVLVYSVYFCFIS
jgi:hypothetical protein